VWISLNFFASTLVYLYNTVKSIRIGREKLRYLRLVSSSVCPSMCISVAHTGWISVKFNTGMYIVETLQIWLKSEKKLGLLLEYLSTLVLVLQLDKSAKESHCCIYMTNLMQLNGVNSIRRIDTADLHRVYDNMLQRAQKCIDVQWDHFQHLL
jgi:hypothetical protein